MVAIRVANEVGHDRVIDVAQRLGVSSPLHDYRSLALGAQEVTMLDMAQAYGAMASGGYRVYAHGVERIRRANNDETMWSWRAPDRQRVIEERPLRYMNAMMERVVVSGTATRVRMEGRQIGGKTGTGNDYRDAWFVGFTPGYVAAVWVGNDNFTVTGRVTGGSIPAEIWARFAAVALENVPVRALEMPGEDDYDLGVADPNAISSITAVGAPIGAVIGAPDGPRPVDNEDRSLDFGPEG
jgi:penicillin-binding protein 1A